MKDNDSDETTVIMVMVNVVQSGQMLVKLTTVKNKGELIAGGGGQLAMPRGEVVGRFSGSTWRSSMSSE